MIRACLQVPVSSLLYAIGGPVSNVSVDIIVFVDLRDAESSLIARLSRGCLLCACWLICLQKSGNLRALNGLPV